MERNVRRKLSIPPTSFIDFPEDVQLRILASLLPPELAAFALTCKTFFNLCRHDRRLWFYKWNQLSRVFDNSEESLGFWFGQCFINNSPPSPLTELVVFEWSPLAIRGFKILPSEDRSHDVVKKPFLWIVVDSDGTPSGYLDNGAGTLSVEEEEFLSNDREKLRSGVIPVRVSFPKSFIMALRKKGKVEAKKNLFKSGPVELMSEIYWTLRKKYGGLSTRRSDWRRDEDYDWRGCFLKVNNCTPHPERPMQGLWKGISKKGILNFYKIYYNYNGKVFCDNVGILLPFNEAPNDLAILTFECFSQHLIETPFSPEENDIYDNLEHTWYDHPQHEAPKPSYQLDDITGKFVANIFHEPESEDLIFSEGVWFYNDRVPDYDRKNVKGRVWMYTDGTFGFGRAKDDSIVDLKPLVRDGRILDLVEAP